MTGLNRCSEMFSAHPHTVKHTMSVPSSLFDVQSIAPLLAEGHLFLTPNQRLASRISNAYALYCAEYGHQVVVAPKIHSLDSWIDLAWQQLLLAADPSVLAVRLLSSCQELLLWQQVVEQSEQGALLLRPQATARQLASAYQTLVYWQQDLQSETLRAAFSREDGKSVLAWLEAF